MYRPTIRPDRAAPAIVAAAMLLPGWSIAREFATFLAVGADRPLSDQAPNLWSIVQALPLIYGVPLAGLAMAAAIGCGGVVLALILGGPMQRDRWLPAALLLALVIPGLLPHMRAADFIPALLISAATACQRRDAASVGIAALIVTGALLADSGIAALAGVGAVPMLAATGLIARRFVTRPANDNGPSLNPFATWPA